jgi:hypothetical protein
MPQEKGNGAVQGLVQHDSENDRCQKPADKGQSQAEIQSEKRIGHAGENTEACCDGVHEFSRKHEVIDFFQCPAFLTCNSL